MAQLRVPVQAFRNFLSILLGFALGGLNNLVVLPWAFGDDLASWGLVRVAAAWGTLLGPILAFGAPATMNRFKGRAEEAGQFPELLGTLVWPPVVLFLAFVALPALAFPAGVADMLGLEGPHRAAVRAIACLAGLQAAQIYLAGFLSTRLKTALATFARETFFKFGYLALGLALGLGWIGQAAFLPAFVGLYVLVLLLLLAQSLANRFRIRWSSLGDWSSLVEVRTYGATLILGSSAVVILGQIDIIMVGRLLELSLVPAFTIAAFIATVAQIPSRAFMRLLQPLIAQSLHRDDMTETWRLVRMTHGSLLLAGGWILACLWATTPEMNQLLPSEFQGLDLVILTVGAVKVLQGSALGSQVLLGQSDHYRHTIGLNWTMVAVAIPLNFWMIPEAGLGWGLWGAAMATFCAVAVSILARQWVVWRIWKQWVPSTRSAVILTVVGACGQALHLWSPEGHPALLLLGKATLATLLIGGVAWTFHLAPEGRKWLTEQFAR